MDKKQIFQMNIMSGAFESMRNDFDKILKRTLVNMETKESELSEITLKLKINLEKTIAPDFDSEKGAERTVLKPKFDHKVSSVMNIKDEESGSFKGDYELVWDEDLQDFVVRPIDNGQMDLFAQRDGDGNIVYVDAEYEDKTDNALPAWQKLLGDGSLSSNGYQDSQDVQGGGN